MLLRFRNEERAEQTADDVCANNKRAPDVEVATDPVSPALPVCPSSAFNPLTRANAGAFVY